MTDSFSPKPVKHDPALWSEEPPLPRHLASLFVLRIMLYVCAAGLAIVKVLLSPPLLNYFLDVFSDLGPGLEGGLRALNLAVSGLLAVALALVVTTLFIQARLRGEIELGATGVLHDPREAVES
ncbi:MAG: hypothetical protein JO117_09655 [Verrucomicrobia bacterium]|nr:hypothetical protein [Verrucomicrobiota bacterium]